jgi:hypothetical protein
VAGNILAERLSASQGDLNFMEFHEVNVHTKAVYGNKIEILPAHVLFFIGKILFNYIFDGLFI